jgi:DNA repair exonuclease SbcCD ATPase subunit
MKITEILSEGPSQPGQDYQKMMNFVRSAKLQGVPADQQVAVALFKELEKQQQQNKALSSELDAAEERIDVATQRGDVYGGQLKKHQSELDRERQDIDAQKTAMGDLDAQHTKRAKASVQQIQDLTSKLETIKTKPGVDQNVAAQLEQQIAELKNKGVSADKVKELEQSISSVQNMQSVDDVTIADLMAKVKDAQNVAQELEKTKQQVGQDLDQTTAQALAKVDQVTHEIDQLKKLAGMLEPAVNDIIIPKLKRLETDSLDTDATIGELEHTIDKLSTAVSARQAIVRGANPQQIAQKMVQQGHLKR